MIMEDKEMVKNTAVVAVDGDATTASPIAAAGASNSKSGATS